MSFVPLAFCSCSDKKPTKDIIAPKPVVKKSSAPTKMQDYVSKSKVGWLGSSYVVTIKRHADTELPLVSDESGNKYYDNEINVSVIRPDGTSFFEKTFRKSDFSSCVSETYLEKSALLGIVFEKAEGDNLRFAASVGSPDALSDEYVPLVVSISRTGGVTVTKDTMLDPDGSAPADDEDEGV